MSGDGTVLAVGAPGWLDDRPGYVKVYYKQLDSTWLLAETFSGDSGEAAGDQFGHSVSLSEDGKTLAIGAPYNDGNGGSSGHVQVYNLVDKEWQQLGQDINGEAAYDDSGESVSLSADGKTVAIGAYGNDGNGINSGHVRVYHLDDSGGSSSWIQVGEDIDGVAAFDNAGWSVSLSSDGKSVAVGSPLNGNNGYRSGHVRVFGI